MSADTVAPTPQIFVHEIPPREGPFLAHLKPTEGGFLSPFGHDQVNNAPRDFSAQSGLRKAKCGAGGVLTSLQENRPRKEGT